MGALNALGLPPGAGIALGFAAGVGVGTLLSPFGALALPFILQSMQMQATKGGVKTLMAEDDWTAIYPLSEDKRTVSEVFSRAPYFAIARNKQIEHIVENPYISAVGGAAWQVVNYILQFRPKEVVVRNIGRNTENLLRQRGVLVRRI